MSVADPALQIRGGGGGGGGRAVIQTLREGGGAQSPKKFFRPFGPHFGRRIRGGGQTPQAPALDLPLGVMAVVSVVAVRAVVLHILHLLELLHSAADLGEGPRWPAL